MKKAATERIPKDIINEKVATVRIPKDIINDKSSHRKNSEGYYYK